ncbi:MAG TPA: Uma2 family endonuclease [Leptospiraceae bacterium]|nr:Uma2 family endonuclease [Leptospiraceae bacterium]HNI25511.1 Uma2 family endonuclease [Leptospiraceae bacterium]
MIVVDPGFFINSSPLVKTYTLDEFFALPEPKDFSKMELINGVLYMSPMPEWKHSNIIEKLDTTIKLHIHSRNIGGKLYSPRAGIKRTDTTWLEPDLFYLSRESVLRFEKEIPTTADLVIEVLRPSTFEYDKTAKADTYEALGIRELWLIDPNASQVEVRENENADTKWDRIVIYEKGDLLESKVIEGLKISVEEICA